jgi:DNA-binding response OmpR family regulator
MQRILLNQDHWTSQGLQHALRHHGYESMCQATGVAVIEALRRFPVHLLILETQLPDGSGFDLCRQIRRLGFQQPILMLTAQDSEIDKVLGLELGADDYVTKPYCLRELLSRIRALLRRAYGELAVVNEGPLYAAELVLDRASGQVWRDDELLNLSPTEFRLLVFLVQHRGQALSRQQILDAVWGYSAEVESPRTVNVHIHRLREKVERDPSVPRLILTVPGIGYRVAIQ